MHEMVDFRLRKKPRSSSGATRRPNFRLTLTNARTRSGSFSSPAVPAQQPPALGARYLESARRSDEQRGPSSVPAQPAAERMGETGIFLFSFDTVEGDIRSPTMPP